MSQFSSITTDANGIQHLLDDNIRSLQFVDLTNTRFANPDATYTGYGASGFWYTSGELDPGHAPFKATWASEGESAASANRGNLDRFPTRFFLVTTDQEVVIINADDLTVWMRFTRANGGSHGAFAGDTAQALNEAAFHEGWLLLGTDDGLRIADFQEDVGYWMGSGANASRSSKYSDSVSAGLVDRNTGGMLEHTTIAGSGATNNRLQAGTCLCVAVGTKAGTRVAAAGHPSGMTGITLRENNTPYARQHQFVLNYTGWYAHDDNDADSVTPYFRSSVGDNWPGDGVEVGDRINTDTGELVYPTAVEITQLTVDPELDVTDSGASYTVSRIVQKVLLSRDGDLYFTNGRRKVTRLTSSSWFDPPSDNPATGIDAFDLTANTGRLAKAANDVLALALSGSTLFAATNVGVFVTTEDDLALERAVELRYGGSGDVDATYDILEGSSDCTALAIDPETGHLMVASDQSGVSVLTEIDMSIHQAFQFFDSYTATVTALVGFRNPNGPPTVEV